MVSQFIVAAVVGVMLFFSVAVAPTIFKVLPQEWASAYVRAFFPKYYAVLGAACLGAGLLQPTPVPRRIVLVCAGLFALSLFVLTPAINRASDAKDRKRFGVLHVASVAINLAQVVALGVALWMG